MNVLILQRCCHILWFFFMYKYNRKGATVSNLGADFVFKI